VQGITEKIAGKDELHSALTFLSIFRVFHPPPEVAVVSPEKRSALFAALP